MSIVPSPNLAKTHQTARHSSMTSEHHGLSHDLIECLDLLPIVRRVADHAATRRGRQAILSLVCDDESESLAPLESNRSSRNRRVFGSALYRRRDQMSTRHAELAPIATSALEAREEYELVEQALLALSTQNGLSYPPIYAAHSSPFDTKATPDSDDDEWMYLPTDQLSLEHVLQAEQVINMLLRVKEWCSKTETETWIPGLTILGKSILDDVLKPIQHELDSAIEIVRVKSITDPNGRSVSRNFLGGSRNRTL